MPPKGVMEVRMHLASPSGSGRSLLEMGPGGGGEGGPAVEGRALATHRRVHTRPNAGALSSLNSVVHPIS